LDGLTIRANGSWCFFCANYLHIVFIDILTSKPNFLNFFEIFCKNSKFTVKIKKISIIFSIFAAVKTIRRQISACILLAVFLPMLVFSSLHIHEIPQTTDTECSDCVHHNCHGHLSVMATWAHDCVLCQFLTLPMLTAVMMAVMVYVHVCKEYHAQPLGGSRTACCGSNITRGPPLV
jgi:hypothetical protein